MADAAEPEPVASSEDEHVGRSHALDVLEFDRVMELVARRATSELGAELVRARRPSGVPAEVRRRLDAAAEMKTFLEESDSWAPPPIPDVRTVLERLRIEGSVLDEEGLLGIARLLAAGRTARRALPEHEATFPILAERAERLLREPELQERLERSFDDTGNVADGASRRLRDIRVELRDGRNGLVDTLERFQRQLRDGIRVPDASVTVRSGRYCVPVRRDGRSEVGGIVHDESASGQTIYVEPPPAIEPMNRIRELEAEERREVRRILEELTDAVRPLERRLRRSLEALARLDALFAAARYAIRHDGRRPELGSRGERGELQVERGRHPLLLATEEEVVPFDLRLDDDERVLLVSGPNAGGKTVLLKALGLHSAMAQSGVLPPVGAGSRLPFFDGYFAIIGDEQSIDASLSTFSAQVETLTEILEQAGPSSLVLLDEVGSHTDPAEGAALASASLLRLAGQAGLTVATSHLGALKALAGEDARVVNASLEFDSERLRPTYRLRRDRPGRSYAFEIAERLGVPASVIREARARLEESERRMESVLGELEDEEEELERRLAEVAARAEELERREAALEERAEELERRESEVEREARERAERYLLDARTEVEEAIERLEERYREAASSEAERAEAASEARGAVEEAVRKSREAMPERPDREPPEPPDLEPGDRVRIRSLDREGEVQELRGDRVTVAAGGVRLTLPPHDLERLKGAGDEESAGSPREPGDATRGEERRPSLETSSEVHLRGLRVDEVERELMPRLDAAIVADLPRFRIVHGKGSGALRERVRELLEADPRVARFRSGEPAEGGSGVTVVEFGEE